MIKTSLRSMVNDKPRKNSKNFEKRISLFFISSTRQNFSKTSDSSFSPDRTFGCFFALKYNFRYRRNSLCCTYAVELSPEDFLGIVFSRDSIPFRVKFPPCLVHEIHSIFIHFTDENRNKLLIFNCSTLKCQIIMKHGHYSNSKPDLHRQYAKPNRSGRY